MNAAVETILSRYPGSRREVLIPLLQEVQEALGYLPEAAVVRISQHVGLPAAKVYGVATFYNQFRFQPKGRYHVMLCRGTACHVKGSAKLLETVCQTLKLEPGCTSRDKLFSLEVVACMGACGLAPVINVNGEFYAKCTPRKVVKILAALKQKEHVHVYAEA